MCCNYVGGLTVPPPLPNPDEPLTPEDVYATFLVVAITPTVCDGDCGLDLLTNMSCTPQSFEARNDLRLELSEYLIARMEDPRMLEIRVAAQ